MAKSVRRNVLGDASKFGVFFNDSLDGTRSESAEIAGGVYGV